MAHEKKEIRTVVIETLIELAKEHKDIVVLDADVSKSTRTRVFGQSFPERFFNVGIAEMNMASIAAGLATTGKIPFIFSFSVFLALRALEPIRTQIAYPKLNVKIIGGYAGLSAHQHGPTHHCIVDTAIMRSLPNFTVLSPSDWIQTQKAVELIAKMNGPVYLRLGYVNEENVYDQNETFEIGKSFLIREGSDITILSTGVIIRRALQAADTLGKERISVRVLDCPSVKPLDEKAILTAAKETGRIICIEDHTVVGGFGSAVAELLSQNYPVPMKLLGIGDTFTESAPYSELLDRYGLGVPQIINSVRILMNHSNKFVCPKLMERVT